MKIIGRHVVIDDLIAHLGLEYSNILENSDEIYLIDAHVRKNASLIIENRKTLLEIWDGITT